MAVPDGLLLLLREGPRHGYQLAGEFTEHTAGRWKLNTGQVYTTLDRLARDGYVVEDGADPDDPRRRRYRLTPAGADRVGSWLASPPPAPADQRDELVLRVLLSVATRPDEAPEVIGIQRRALLDRLVRIRRTMRDEPGDLVDRMAADAAASRVEADLAWLDRCEERLRASGANTAQEEDTP